MVIFVQRWDIASGQEAAYLEWQEEIIPRMMNLPIRPDRAHGHRAITGSHQVLNIAEFADVEAWNAWYAQEFVQQVQRERYQYVDNHTAELWGPSPLLLQPIENRS